MADQTLSQKEIFKLFMPLCASWMLMSCEGPVMTLLITSIGKDTEVMLAAMGIVMTLSFWIESPIIGLLTTATALAVNRQHYLVLRRFVYFLMFGVTAFGALVALSPLFDWIVINLLGVEKAVADAARPALIFMIPWSAAIAWRRYTQGIMIRNGNTRSVMFGTFTRLITLVVMGYLLWRYAHLSGATAAALTIVAAVMMEAYITHILARPTLMKAFDSPNQLEAEPLTTKKLTEFHLPLSFSMLLWLLAKPVITFGLARADRPTASLAGWEPATNILFLLRAPSMALPEIIIALQRNEETSKTLRKFSLIVGGISSLIVAAFAFSPFSFMLFHVWLKVPTENALLAVQATQIMCVLPLLGSVQCYYRGMLSSLKLTRIISRSVVVSLSLTIITIGFCIVTGVISVATASIAVCVASLGEIVFLRLALRSATRSIPSGEDALAEKAG